MEKKIPGSQPAARSPCVTAAPEDWMVFTRLHIGPIACLFFTYAKILYFSSFRGISIFRMLKIDMERKYFLVMSLIKAIV